MGEKIVIKNIYLNAVTYHLCYHLPTETIKKLSIRYRRILASELKTKAWIDKSSMDEKMHFFNAIGLNLGLSIFPDKIRSGTSLKEILNKYENQKLAAAQKDQAALGFYVLADRESAFLLSLMSMTINHESYIRALEYNKTGFSIKNWSKIYNTPAQTEISEVIDNAKLVANTILNGGLHFDAVKEIFGINDIEMKILLFMYQKRQSFVFRDDITESFIGYITQARASRAMKKLILNEYLDKHLNWQTYQYRISSKGINTVSEFINRIVKANTF